MRFSALLPEATVNYVTNPALRYDTTGWNAAGATLTRVLTQARFGIASLRVVTAGTALHEGTFFRVSSLSGYSGPATASLYVRGAGQVRLRMIDNPAGKEWYTQPMTLVSDRWIRLSVSGTLTGSNDVRLYVETDEGTAKARTFYVDGAQLECKAYPTTYCDGDQTDCRWAGLHYASHSQRPGDTRSGGRWYQLAGEEREQEDLYMTVVGGLGVAPITNNLQAFALEPGAFFSNNKIHPRLITLTFHAMNEQLAERDCTRNLAALHALRQILIDVVKPDRTRGGQPVWFEYDDGNFPVYFQARYDGGLEGEWDIRNQFVNSFPVRLLAVSPFLIEDSQEAQVLDYQDNSPHLRRVAHRKDGAWSHMNYGMNGSVGDLELGPRGQVVASGGFDRVNDDAAALSPFLSSFNVSYFDGERWVSLSGSSNGTVINDVAIAPNGDIYVTGDFTVFNGVAANRIARWDGSTWNALGTGLDADGVHISIDSRGRVYVGGAFTSAGGVPAAFVAYWAGGEWRALGQYSGLDSDVLTMAINPEGDQVYLGGYFIQENGLSDSALMHVALYDPDTDRFSAVGQGFNNNVLELVLDRDGTLYACGDFTTSGTTTLNHIGRFVAGAWRGLGNGMDNNVYSLDIGTNGDIIAVGIFTEAGGVRARNLAVWNGSTWANLDIEISVGDTSLVLLAVQYSPDGDVFLGGFWAGEINSRYAAINLVDNPGTAETFPIIHVSGSGTLRWLENQTSCKRIFLDLTVLPGEEVFLDFRNGLAYSSSRPNLLNYILPGSDFNTFTLLPGENRLACFMTDDVEAGLQILYTPTYWGVDIAPDI